MRKPLVSETTYCFSLSRNSSRKSKKESTFSIKLTLSKKKIYINLLLIPNYVFILRFHIRRIDC